MFKEIGDEFKGKLDRMHSIVEIICVLMMDPSNPIRYNDKIRNLIDELDSLLTESKAMVAKYPLLSTPSFGQYAISTTKLIQGTRYVLEAAKNM